MSNTVVESELKLVINGGFTIACKKKNGGGPGAKRVLCYPGWLDNSGSFDNLSEIFAKNGMEVVAVDPPGCGHSDHLPAFSTYYDFEEVGIINSILIKLGWTQDIILVAHSRGGGIATMAAASFPERFSRLILIESKLIALAGAGAGTYCKSPAVIIRRAHEYAQRKDRKTRIFSTFDEAVEHNWKNEMFPKRNRSTAVNIVKRHIKQLPDGTWTFIHDPRIYNQKQMMQISLEGATQVVRELKCPVLRIDACDDKDDKFMSFVTNGNKLLEDQFMNRRRILSAERFIIAGSAHHVHSDDAPACAKIIFPWLQKSLSPLDRSKL